VRRFLCTGCGKTFTCLPDIVLPFKHYVAEEIERVLRHLFDGGRLSQSPSGADERTLRRWWNEYSHKLSQWAGALESRVFQFSGHLPSLMCQSNPLVRLEEVLSLLPALPRHGGVMVKALWLKTSHQLRLPRPP
jgi:hypothetical protein